MTEGRFLVTGSGRCGTKWTSAALTVAGVLSGHERVYGPDVLPWELYVRGEVSWMAAPRMAQVDVPVALLVRHPMAVVRSWVEIGFFTWDLGNPTHAPLRAAWPEVYAWGRPADMALDMWVRTTGAALERAEMIVRLEDMGVPLFGRLLAWCGGQPGNARMALESVPRCNRHEESRGRTGLSYTRGWDAHDRRLADRALALAISLGYSRDHWEE